MNPVTSTGCTCVDIGVNANLESVDKFCYLGDMLSVDGHADAAVENRIRIPIDCYCDLFIYVYSNIHSVTYYNNERFSDETFMH